MLSLCDAILRLLAFIESVWNPTSLSVHLILWLLNKECVFEFHTVHIKRWAVVSIKLRRSTESQSSKCLVRESSHFLTELMSQTKAKRPAKMNPDSIWMTSAECVIMHLLLISLATTSQTDAALIPSACFKGSPALHLSTIAWSFQLELFVALIWEKKTKNLP